MRVPPGLARAQLTRLRARGLSIRAISELSGVSIGALQHLARRDRRHVALSTQQRLAGSVVIVDRLPRWRRHAACVGRLSLFYATDSISERLAVAVCSTCGVRERCARDAAEIETDPALVFGTRAGLTAAERRLAVPAAACSTSARRAEPVIGIRSCACLAALHHATCSVAVYASAGGAVAATTDDSIGPTILERPGDAEESTHWIETATDCAALQEEADTASGPSAAGRAEDDRLRDVSFELRRRCSAANDRAGVADAGAESDLCQRWRWSPQVT